ncbi:MAG: hypothetical protein HC836_46540 [Richelia sp. RM2_1_2]|nr:hypothetical protein [Richelia sp. SM1_7_0]NJO27776.1 hypothetical protein [Richelia sp. SL_2_1]NJO65296.1 hypothetical protein [Richelia sp. RM2_1_2]
MLSVQIEKALIQEFELELNGKNCNPNYSQITGLTPKSLAQSFRVYCVENEIQLTEALEIAIQEFLDKRQNQPSSPLAYFLFFFAISFTFAPRQ